MTKPIELIHWIDSSVHGGWHQSGDQSYAPMTCQTVGFLIHETLGAVTLALNIALDENALDVGEAVTIPKACILTRSALNMGSDNESQMVVGSDSDRSYRDPSAGGVVRDLVGRQGT